jgi:hypothetical protein
MNRPAPILLVLALTAGGCGYGRGPGGPRDLAGYQWRSVYRDDVRTVAVPVFGNRTFRRGFELALSKAVVNQLETSTPYKVAPRERADTILEGEIVDTHLRALSADIRTGLPQEQLFIVRVNFTWKDLRTGKILVERRRFEQTTTYYPTLGEGHYVGGQQNVERLAVAIVQELQADW